MRSLLYSDLSYSPNQALTLNESVSARMRGARTDAHSYMGRIGSEKMQTAYT